VTNEEVVAFQASRIQFQSVNVRELTTIKPRPARNMEDVFPETRVHPENTGIWRFHLELF
jgi:hypothetical protein